METIKAWIDVAKSDLKSSRLLHENGHYRNSYYLFQQASEKANKAFVLYLESLDENELRKIGHNHINIHVKNIEKSENDASQFLSILKMNPAPFVFSEENYTEYHNNLQKSLQDINEMKNDIINLQPNDLMVMAKNLREIKRLKIRHPEKPNKKYKEALIRYSEWIGGFGTPQALEAKEEMLKVLEDKEQMQQIYDATFKQFYPMYFELYFIQYTFFYTSILTTKHETVTRYPDGTNNPETIYNKKLPVIVKQTVFMNFLEEALNKLENRLSQ